MAGSALRHLAVVAPTSAGPEEPLPVAEFATYQRQLLADFLVSRRATTSPTTVHSALSALRANLFPWLEQRGLYVWEVTPGDLDAWAASLKNSVKTRTHHGYFAQVAHFYEWLVARRGDELRRRLGIVVANPVDRFNRARRLPEGERLVPIPREEVIDYFLAASRSRIQDAASDAKWLQACRNYALPAEDWFTPHGLRRACATRLYKALRAQGFRDPLVYVKEQLGHEYLSTTQRYCQLDDDYKYFLVQEASAALTRHYAAGASQTG